MEILRIANVEGTFGSEEQLTDKQQHEKTQPAIDFQSLAHTRVCYVDGAWREHDEWT